MKKVIAMLMTLALTAAMLLTPVYATETEPDPNTGSIGNDKYQMQLVGKISTSTMMVVVVTTSVEFMYDLDADGWNQIVGGDATIANKGQSAVTLDVIKVTVTVAEDADDITLIITNDPAKGSRQISLALAPKSEDNTGWDAVEDYALLTTVDSTEGKIPLAGEDGLAGGGAVATFALYGKISALDEEMTNWAAGETFTVTTVIKAAVVESGD